MSLILSIETTTPICSVALAKDGVLLHLEEADGQLHASLLSVFIQKLFDNKTTYQLKDLDAISVSAGPGSYTGIRIGLATAKGLCYALNIPLIGINTLEALAFQAIQQFEEGASAQYHYLPMIDARRMEVYMAIYDSQLTELTAAHPKVMTEADFLALAEQNSIVYFGNGANKYYQEFVKLTKHNSITYVKQLCSARNLIKLAEKKYIENSFSDISYYKGAYLKPFKKVISHK